MSLDLRVNALTARLRSEFWKAWHQVAKPAPWREVVTVVPSTTKIENFLNATPVPGLTRWAGTRNFAQIDSFVYQVRNDTYHVDLSAKLEDIEDDQVGLLAQQPAFMSEKAKEFPGRATVKLLGQGLGSPIALAQGNIGNLNAFDGLAFFSNRTTAANGFGVGNNLVNFTAASGDGKVYNLAALFYGAPLLKPLAWQNRSGPDFETDSGTPAAKKNRVVTWWVDLRGAPFFTYWWNAVGCVITNTPTVAEMHAIFSAVIAAFRSFRYPQSVTAEDGEYVHEQTVFDSGNLCYVASTYLSEQLTQALEQDWVPQNIGQNTVATTNKWKGKARWFVSRFLDAF